MALVTALIQVICVAAGAMASPGAGAELDSVVAAAYGVYAGGYVAAGAPPSTSAAAADPGALQMFAFREATARVLEATHGWINCLLSARPRPPPEISKCTEQALPAVADILVALSTAGWAIRYKSIEELDVVRKTIMRMADVRTQVHSCVESLNPHLQVAGRCYTVL